MMGQAERGKPFSLQDGLHQVIGSLVTLWSWQARLPGRYEMIREMYLRAGVGGGYTPCCKSMSLAEGWSHMFGLPRPRGAARNSLPYLTLGAAVPRRKEG